MLTVVCAQNPKKQQNNNNKILNERKRNAKHTAKRILAFGETKEKRQQNIGNRWIQGRTHSCAEINNKVEFLLFRSFVCFSFFYCCCCWICLKLLYVYVTLFCSFVRFRCLFLCFFDFWKFSRAVYTLYYFYSQQTNDLWQSAFFAFVLVLVYIFSTFYLRCRAFVNRKQF